MPYDKYHNWPLGTPCWTNRLKEQVLKDLEETEDETDRLEILDSFEAYVERVNTAELAEHLSNQILLTAGPFLTGAIRSKLPVSMPIPRLRRAPIVET